MTRRKDASRIAAWNWSISRDKSARRGLDRVTPREAEELRTAWRRYCEVIDELDKTTAEFETLRTYAG